MCSCGNIYGHASPVIFLIIVLYRIADMSFLIEFSLEFVSVVKVFTPVVIRVVDRDKMKYLTIIICSLFVDHGSFLVLFLEYIPMCIGSLQCTSFLFSQSARGSLLCFIFSEQTMDFMSFRCYPQVW